MVFSHLIIVMISYPEVEMRRAVVNQLFFCMICYLSAVNSGSIKACVHQNVKLCSNRVVAEESLAFARPLNNDVFRELIQGLGQMTVVQRSPPRQWWFALRGFFYRRVEHALTIFFAPISLNLGRSASNLTVSGERSERAVGQTTTPFQKSSPNICILGSFLFECQRKRLFVEVSSPDGLKSLDVVDDVVFHELPFAPRIPFYIQKWDIPIMRHASYFSALSSNSWAILAFQAV